MSRWRAHAHGDGPYYAVRTVTGLLTVLLQLLIVARLFGAL